MVTCMIQGDHVPPVGVEEGRWHGPQWPKPHKARGEVFRTRVCAPGSSFLCSFHPPFLPCLLPSVLGTCVDKRCNAAETFKATGDSPDINQLRSNECQVVLFCLGPDDSGSLFFFREVARGVFLWLLLSGEWLDFFFCLRCLATRVFNVLR